MFTDLLLRDSHPLSGVLTAGIGFVLGWLIAVLLGLPFRRRERLGWR